MLKLEKIAKTLEISISLRQREPFLNSSLLKAFGIALVLHLIAALLFQVSPFKIIGSQVIFPPAIVDAEIATPPEGTVIAYIDTEDSAPRYIKEPKGASLPLPELPLSKTFVAPAILREDPVTYSPSSSDRREEFFTPTLNSSHSRAKNSIELVVSGDLGQRKWTLSGLSELLKRPMKLTIRLTYDVQVDDRTGTIFWYEPHQLEDTSLAGIAEKILNDLRFDALEDSFVSTGEIEIHFYEGPTG